MSDDGEVAYLAFTFNFGKNGWNDIPDAAQEVEAITKIDGVTVHLAGFGGQARDAAEAFEGIDTSLILITFLVVIVILLFTYRSPLLWILPIISAAVAYVLSGGVVYLLAKYADLTVNGQSQAILGILVIGAGTDYALLLIARYREELRRHEDRHEAMGFALHRAAPAILASAATVVVGMLCLSFADLNSTAGLGPVLAVGVATTFLVMVTLLPALLVIFGRWMFWPKRPTFGSPEPTQSGLWARVGNRIAPRPRAVWVVTAGLLMIACLGLFRLDASGMSTADTYTKEFDSIKGQQVLVDHGLQDTSNTVQVIANSDEIAAVQEAMTGIDGLSDPTPAQEIGNGRSYFEETVGADISSTAAFDIVEATRDAVHDVPGADALVGGGSAFYLDTKIASERDNRVIIPIVLVVVFLILVLLLRALAGAIDPDGHRGPVVRCGAGDLDDPVPGGVHAPADLRTRRRVQLHRSWVPAVHLRVPGGPRHRLQHLPDDEGARGVGNQGHPQGIAGRPGVDRRCDHLGRARARCDVPGAGLDTVRVPGRAGHGGGPGRSARHDDRAVGPGDRHQPRPRGQDLVAEQARPG